MRHLIKRGAPVLGRKKLTTPLDLGTRITVRSVMLLHAAVDGFI